MARFVLVHGAFCGGWCWEPVVELLEQRGHVVSAPDLPGSGADPTPVRDVTLAAYAVRVADVLAEREQPAILVAHSMAGMAITQAAANHPERIARLVYLAAFLPRDGQSLLDLTRLPEGADDQVQANLTIEGDPAARRSLTSKAMAHALFNCATRSQLDWALERVAPAAARAVPRAGPDRRLRHSTPTGASTSAARSDHAIPPRSRPRMVAETPVRRDPRARQ